MPAPALLLAILGLVMAVACEPTTPPPGAGSSSSAPPLPSGVVAGKPTVTVSGGVVQIVGLGTGTTPDFDLPGGTTEIKVTACASNQVPPFVQLFNANHTMLGFIADPVYQAKIPADGKYYLTISSNPDCVWSIELTPK
jgi:hypothetical protein